MSFNTSLFGELYSTPFPQELVVRQLPLIIVESKSAVDVIDVMERTTTSKKKRILKKIRKKYRKLVNRPTMFLMMKFGKPLLIVHPELMEKIRAQSVHLRVRDAKIWREWNVVE